jgi:CheY-like chemotaxis protein
VFTVKLPLMVPRTAGELTRRHPTAGLDMAERDLAQLRGLRVLIVDDEPDSNEAVRTCWSWLVAQRYARPIRPLTRQVLAGWKPDVLVSDVGMPGEDGYALIASVRDTGTEVGQIPAVALTAYASRDDKVRLLSAGFQAHVPKPVDPAELIAVVASLGRGIGKL